MIAIKKLQNNFTTPEQSKRLLEMGVPAWTANIMFDKNRRRYELIETEDESWAETQRTLLYNGGAIPCWSVGRLTEIYITCIEHYTGDERLTFGQDTIRLGMIDCVIAAIEVACDDGDMHFSKLEE